MVGMCVADAIGHPLEFMPVVDDPFATGSGFDLATLRYTNPLNAFKLQPGQSVTYILTLPTPPPAGDTPTVRCRAFTLVAVPSRT